jgi:hypothetical protein
MSRCGILISKYSAACSTKLSTEGWNIAFIPEKLQVGLAPESLRAHIKQRMRWVFELDLPFFEL